MKIPVSHVIASHTISATPRGKKTVLLAVVTYILHSCTKGHKPTPYLQYCKSDLYKPLSITVEEASEFSRDMYSLQQMCRKDTIDQESMCRGRTHRLEHAVVGSICDFRNNE